MILKKLNVIKKRKWLDKNFRLDAKTMNYLCNISNKLRYIYVETPKVACSSIKYNLHALETGYDVKGSVHKKSLSPLASPLKAEFDLNELFDNYFKFTFVREPYSRSLSCYLDKIQGHKKNNRYRDQLGLPQFKEVSFEDFLHEIEDRKKLLINPHWTPQADIVSVEKIAYDYVGRFENLSLELEKIIQLICVRNNLDIPELTRNIKRRSPHQTNAKEKLQSYLTVSSKKMIREIYHEDFDVFGFEY